MFRFEMLIAAESLWIRFRPILLLLLPRPRRVQWGQDRQLPTACRNRHTQRHRLYPYLRPPEPRPRIRGTFLLASRLFLRDRRACLPRPRAGCCNVKYLNPNAADLQELYRRKSKPCGGVIHRHTRSAGSQEPARYEPAACRQNCLYGKRQPAERGAPRRHKQLPNSINSTVDRATGRIVAGAGRSVMLASFLCCQIGIEFFEAAARGLRFGALRVTAQEIAVGPAIVSVSGL
jgi:hypothetical protein